MYQIDAYKLTARDAADEFAKTFQEQPRKVQRFKPTGKIGPGLQGTFQLVDGSQWYEVWLSFDYRYWNIEAIHGCP
jgi:hypothetical protein